MLGLDKLSGSVDPGAILPHHLSPLSRLSAQRPQPLLASKLQKYCALRWQNK
jgi:hypothetical protein